MCDTAAFRHVATRFSNLVSALLWYLFLPKRGIIVLMTGKWLNGVYSNNTRSYISISCASIRLWYCKFLRFGFSVNSKIPYLSVNLSFPYLYFLTGLWGADTVTDVGRYTYREVRPFQKPQKMLIFWHFWQRLHSLISHIDQIYYRCWSDMKKSGLSYLLFSFITFHFYCVKTSGMTFIKKKIWSCQVRQTNTTVWCVYGFIHAIYLSILNPPTSDLWAAAVIFRSISSWLCSCVPFLALTRCRGSRWGRPGGPSSVGSAE